MTAGTRSKRRETTFVALQSLLIFVFISIAIVPTKAFSISNYASSFSRRCRRHPDSSSPQARTSTTTVQSRTRKTTYLFNYNWQKSSQSPPKRESHSLSTAHNNQEPDLNPTDQYLSGIDDFLSESETETQITELQTLADQSEPSSRDKHTRVAKDKTDASASSKLKKKKPFGAQFVENFLSHPWVEVGEALLVILSTFLVAVDTLANLDPIVYSLIAVAGDAVAYIFCFLFILRWYANCNQGPKYFTKPFVLVDIVVVILPLLLPTFNSGHLLPQWLTSKGGLLNLRLLRILRLQRVLTNMETFASFQRALGVTKPRDVKAYELQLARVLLSLFTLLSVATGLIYTTEHNVNPALPDFFTALYFGLTTLTTVGFGDITPVTNGGKLVVSGSILAGVAIIPVQAASLFEALLDYDKQRNLEQQQQEEAEEEQKAIVPPNNSSQRGMIDAITPCESCGTTMHWVDATFCWSCGNKL